MFDSYFLVSSHGFLVLLYFERLDLTEVVLGILAQAGKRMRLKVVMHFWCDIQFWKFMVVKCAQAE